ncbi:unnamed protein product [Paramecium sonneborni]|uniref:UBC core domain-containing protein n=1 Tax=Paramecium sonneborni TaxID=65129 RepID=A0A8S1Q6C2_9CILI|nr:unnamed protein product [Paramecium sonneborni]
MNDLLLHSQSSNYLTEEVINQAAKDPETRNNIIKFEYKLLSVYAHKFSIILLPKTEQITEWHGLISISYGLYAKGKFKFLLNFPKTFPESIPKIRFLYPLFHPLIDEYNNVDVDTLIPKWKYGQDCMVYNLLNKLYEMFIDVSYYDCVTSFNPRAAQLFSNDINSYAEEVKKQVAYSEQQLYENRDDFILKIKEPIYNTQTILQKLQDINSQKNLSFDQKKKDLLNFILQQSKQNNLSQ